MYGKLGLVGAHSRRRLCLRYPLPGKKITMEVKYDKNIKKDEKENHP
jgi:hypothetical protein